MISFNHSKQLLLTCSLTILLSACAANKVAVSDSIQQKSAQAASEAKFTPEQAIDEAEQKLLSAKEQGLDFYSPLHLKQAEESIAQAREYLIKPPEDMNNAPLMSAIAAQQYIDNAYENKKKVETNLKESFDNLEIVQALKAQSHLPDDYQDIMESLNDIIQEIEQGKIASAKQNELELLTDLANLEIDTLKSIHLTEANSFFERASDVDADEYAELTYEKAEAAIESAENFIEKSYRDRQGVKESGINALIAAKKAYFVAIETESIVKMNREMSEKHTLETMAMLNKIYLSVAGQDISPDKLFNQTEEIVIAIEQLKAKSKDKDKSSFSAGITFSAPAPSEISVETINEPEPRPEINTSINSTESLEESSLEDGAPQQSPETIEQEGQEQMDIEDTIETSISSTDLPETNVDVNSFDTTQSLDETTDTETN